MNQPEIRTPNVTTPLQQHRVQLISKGYSYLEIKEDDAVVCIFKACVTDSPNDLMGIAPISNN